MIQNAPLQQNYYASSLPKAQGAARLTSNASVDLLPSSLHVVTKTTIDPLSSSDQLLVMPPTTVGEIRAMALDTIPSLKRNSGGGGVTAEDNTTLIELSKMYSNNDTGNNPDQYKTMYGSPSTNDLEELEDSGIFYGQPSTRCLDDDDDDDNTINDIAELI